MIKLIDFRWYDTVGKLAWCDDFFCKNWNCLSFLGYSDRFVAGSGTGHVLEASASTGKITVSNTYKASKNGIAQIIGAGLLDSGFLSIDIEGEAIKWSD